MMEDSATQRQHGTESAYLLSGRHSAHRPALRYLGPLAAGLATVVCACGYTAPHNSGAAIWHGRAHPVVAAAHRQTSPRTSQFARITGQHADMAGDFAHGSGSHGPAGPAVPGPAAASYTGPHFATPQAAMSYLTAAYNSRNATALHAVTDPGAFTELTAMRSEAVSLRLVSCAPRQHGDYMCYFRHDYPASMHRSGHGTSEFIVAPARNPGWYMYFLLQCG